MNATYQRFRINGTEIIHKVGSYVVIKAHKKAISIDDFEKISDMILCQEGGK